MRKYAQWDWTQCFLCCRGWFVISTKEKWGQRPPMYGFSCNHCNRLQEVEKLNNFCEVWRLSVYSVSNHCLLYNKLFSITTLMRLFVSNKDYYAIPNSVCGFSMAIVVVRNQELSNKYKWPSTSIFIDTCTNYTINYH